MANVYRTRVLTYAKFETLDRCRQCSAPATLELFTELDDVITSEKICDACFKATAIG